MFEFDVRVRCFPFLISMPNGFPNLRSRLNRIKLLLCDVDGVLTDGSVFIGGAREIKQFNIQDDLGLVFLLRAGLKVGWVSARPVGGDGTCGRANSTLIFSSSKPTGSARSARSKNFCGARNWIGKRYV